MKNKMWINNKITSVLLIFCLTVSFTLPFLTVDADAAVYSGSSIVSNNIHDHDYSGYQNVTNSYLVPYSDGSFTRVESFGDVILLEKYNSNFTLAWQATVPMELELFGGFYSGDDNYYFVFGQPNYSHSDSVTEIQIVKYTKDWARSTVYTVKGQNIVYPFYGCNTDFAEVGNNIIIRCGHLTYPDDSGMCYQGTMTMVVAEESDFIRNIKTDVIDASAGTIENAGATYIDATYGTLAAVDHSRTNMYGLVGMAYSNHAGSDYPLNGKCKTVTALGQYDATLFGGCPEMMLGGLETSSQYYLAAVATAPMDCSTTSTNVGIVAIPRADFSGSQIQINYLTGFAVGSTMTCSNPFIVKVDSTKFCVLWEQRDGYTDTEKVYYAFIDGSGNRLTDTKTIDGCLSDCQPVVVGSNIVWYMTNGAEMKIYAVSTSISSGSSSGVYSNSAAVYGGIDYSAVFDFSYYCAAYPDIRVLYGNDPQAALVHFITYGMSQGRQASANFNVYTYKNNYTDLQNAYGADLKKYYMHFVSCGNAEGRNGRSTIK